ncbi:MAG: hypothetical protein HN416_17925 [Nitrospina sp.]|jgi:hypothetical protein|nr:hypothetical protein [Nitrospina sp.]
MIANKQFGEIFLLKITKVRRWVREFLPPDEKAKKRSGYTREMSEAEAWEVFWGGHILVELDGYSIAEAKRIISDLRDWMKSVGLYPGFSKSQRDSVSISIEISKQVGKELSFSYICKEILEKGFDEETKIVTERYRHFIIGETASGRFYGTKRLNISNHFDEFMYNMCK